MNQMWYRVPWPLVYAVSLLLSLMIFAPAMRGGFIMDDWGYISQNEWLTSAPSPLRFWLNLHQIDYWPLSYSLYWGLWRLFGSDSLAYHVLNICLHALNVTLLFQLLKGHGKLVAASAALLFLIHPQQVQAVAWIFQLKTLLATALAFGTLLLLQSGKIAAAWCLFCAALLAKTSVVMLPLFLLAYSSVRARHYFERPRWGWISAFLFTSFAAGLITLHVNGQHADLAQARLGSSDYIARAGFICGNLGFYLQHFIWPSGLSFLHLDAATVPLTAKLYGIVAGVGTFGLGVALWWRLAPSPWLIILWLGLAFYLINILPALGLVYVPAMKLTPVSNHWAYLANAGLAGLCGLGFEAVLRHQAKRTRLALVAVVGAACLVLAYDSRIQAATYVSEEAIWRDEVARYPDAAIGYYNLGTALNKIDQQEQAAAAFAKAIHLDPGHAKSHYNLAVYAMVQQRWGDAAPLLRRTIALFPEFAPGYNNLGYTLWQMGRKAEAIAVLKEGLHRAPPYPELNKNLCLYLSNVNLLDEAKAACALKQDPAPVINGTAPPVPQGAP